MNTKVIQKILGFLACFTVAFTLSSNVFAADEHAKDTDPASAEKEKDSKKSESDHSHAGDDHSKDAHGEHGDDGHDSGISTSPLDFKTDLAVWSFVVFCLLFLLLSKFAWGPISSALDEREKGIEENISRALRANEEAQALLAQHEKKLAAAAEEVREIMEEARRDAETTHNDIIAKANAEAEDREARAERKIETATNVALKELAELSAKMAVDLATKALRDNEGAIDQTRLIDEALAMLPTNDTPENN